MVINEGSPCPVLSPWAFSSNIFSPPIMLRKGSERGVWWWWAAHQGETTAVFWCSSQTIQYICTNRRKSIFATTWRRRSIFLMFVFLTYPLHLLRPYFQNTYHFLSSIKEELLSSYLFHHWLEGKNVLPLHYIKVLNGAV